MATVINVHRKRDLGGAFGEGFSQGVTNALRRKEEEEMRKNILANELALKSQEEERQRAMAASAITNSLAEQMGLNEQGIDMTLPENQQKMSEIQRIQGQLLAPGQANQIGLQNAQSMLVRNQEVFPLGPDGNPDYTKTQYVSKAELAQGNHIPVATAIALNKSKNAGSKTPSDGFIVTADGQRISAFRSPSGVIESADGKPLTLRSSDRFVTTEQYNAEMNDNKSESDKEFDHKVNKFVILHKSAKPLMKNETSRVILEDHATFSQKPRKGSSELERYADRLFTVPDEFKDRVDAKSFVGQKLAKKFVRAYHNVVNELVKSDKIQKNPELMPSKEEILSLMQESFARDYLIQVQSIEQAEEGDKGKIYAAASNKASNVKTLSADVINRYLNPEAISAEDPKTTPELPEEVKEEGGFMSTIMGWLGFGKSAGDSGSSQKMVPRQRVNAAKEEAPPKTENSFQTLLDQANLPPEARDFFTREKKKWERVKKRPMTEEEARIMVKTIKNKYEVR